MTDSELTAKALSAIRERMARQKMSKAELSRLSGIARPNLITMLSADADGRAVKVTSLSRIGNALGLTEAELFGTPQPAPPKKPRPAVLIPAPIPNSMEIPLLGTVGAGPGEDEAFPDGETILIPDVYGHPDGLAGYRVKGRSMESDAILDGDYLIVRRSPVPKAGEKVVAWVAEQNGCVVKTFRSRNRLESTTGGFWSHRVGDDDCVYGVLVGVVRKV